MKRFFIYLLVVCMLIVLTACDNQSKTRIPEELETYCHFNREASRWIESGKPYLIVECDECGGSGEVDMSTAGRIAFGIITFGNGFLVDKTECTKCHRGGLIMKRIISQPEEIALNE